MHCIAIEIYIIIDDADLNTMYQECTIDNITSLKYANKLLH